ncbi:MAG: hypothetical protein E7315_00340 [Clostridiales bacterium]|nr:hypothetical protein [Clostridiales bacterium]
MNDVIKISLGGIICAVLILIVKQYKSEYSPVIGTAFLVMVAVLAISKMEDVVKGISALGDMAGVGADVISSVIKMIFVALVARIAASVCEDVGSQAVVTGIDIGSRILMLASAFPIFKALIEGIGTALSP